MSERFVLQHLLLCDPNRSFSHISGVQIVQICKKLASTLHLDCSMWCTACCIRQTTCDVRHAACHMRHAANSVQYAACRMLHTTNDTRRTTNDMRRAPRGARHAICGVFLLGRSGCFASCSSAMAPRTRAGEGALIRAKARGNASIRTKSRGSTSIRKAVEGVSPKL